MTKIFTPVPRKYKSKLHKKMEKLTESYDKAEGKPLTQARILKSAVSVQHKIKEKEK